MSEVERLRAAIADLRDRRAAVDAAITAITALLKVRQERPCTHTHVTARGFRFICIRPFHGGDHIYVDQNRRNNGKTPSADKHVMVRSGTVSPAST